MLRQQSLCRGVVCLTAAIALLSVGTEWAVARGGGGGGHGGGGSRGGFSRGGYGGYGYGRGYGGYGYSGYGYGRGYYGYGSGYGWGYGPNYYDYGYAVPVQVPVEVPTYLNPIAPPATPEMPLAAALNGSAQIDVALPQADAKVWVEGTPMTEGSGTRRSLVSPALEPGYKYSYQVTASWMENGQEVRAERTVRVAPDQRSFADFTKVNQRTMPPAN